MMLRRTNLLVSCVVLMALGFARPVDADTIYFENFNAATPGQSLLAPPLNWSPSPYGGDIFAGPTAHPGWDGNAVVGSLSVPWMYHYVNRDLPGMPTTGLITLTFDAWAYDIWSGGVISLKTDGGTGNIQLNPWKNQDWNNVWAVGANGAFTGTVGKEAVSPQNFMRNTTVHGALYIDYESHEFWGTLTDAGGIYTFGDTRFSFVGNPRITSMEILQDLRWPYPGSNWGTDYDNITITHTPAVTEPASLLLLGTGLAGLVRVVRRRRQ